MNHNEAVAQPNVDNATLDSIKGCALGLPWIEDYNDKRPAS